MALGNVSRVAVAILLTLIAVNNARASHEAEHGADLSVSLQGSANAIGVVNRLDTAIGYRFNRFVGLSLGMPVYFVKPSDSTIQTNGADSASGIGNVYASLRLTLDRSTFLFTSVVTGTAPTGDKVKGLSTGRGSVDWTNTFSNDFYWVIPYVSVGVANTISDTTFFVRPFTSIGFVGHVEGGSYVRVSRFSSVGISGYKVLPSGKQTIVSRLVPREPTTASSGETGGGGPPFTPPGRAVGLIRRGGTESGTPAQSFEVVYETVGEADLAKDHGASAWLSIYPTSDVDFYLGVSRSFPFDLNTFFFGASFNFASMIRRARH